jgi:hypothetical protein
MADTVRTAGAEVGGIEEAGVSKVMVVLGIVASV